MQPSMRRTLAILFLSGTTALAGPVLAQQQDDPNNPLLLPKGQKQDQSQGQNPDQGSGATNGGAMNGGSTESGTDGNATTKTPESGATGSGSAQTGSGENQTTEKPADKSSGQNAPSSGKSSTESGSTDKANRKPTAEGGTSTDNAGTKQQGESGSQSTEGSAATGKTKETTSSSASGDTTNINISTEQRTEIHKVIKESHVRPVKVDFEVNVGTLVPRTVELHPLPPRIIKIVPAYRAYKYIMLADGRILIIEPSSLKIVYIITA